MDAETFKNLSSSEKMKLFKQKLEEVNNYVNRI